MIDSLQIFLTSQDIVDILSGKKVTVCSYDDTELGEFSEVREIKIYLDAEENCDV